MSLHSDLKRIKATLEALVKQGRALLSCEDIGPNEVNSYRDLVDTVLEGSDLSLDDLSAAAGSNAQDAPTPTVQPVDGLQPESGQNVSTESDDDSSDDEEEEEEDDVNLDDKDLPSDDELPSDFTGDDDDSDIAADANEKELEDSAAGAEESEQEEEEKEPREELEETVDQVNHVVEKIDTFISATEGSGLTTDDVQAMADVQSNFESLKTLQSNSEMVAASRSSALISAYARLTQVTLRNLSKVIK